MVFARKIRFFRFSVLKDEFICTNHKTDIVQNINNIAIGFYFNVVVVLKVVDGNYFIVHVFFY